MSKEFTYRGFTIKELQNMSMDEFLRLLPSRQRRSLQRGLTREQRILLEQAMKRNSQTLTHRRDSLQLETDEIK